MTTKVSLLKDVLNDNEIVILHIDSNNYGVDVPDHLINEDWLKLSINALVEYKMSEDDISFTSHFGGKPHMCVIPYESIWGISVLGDSDIILFYDDAPEDIKMAMKEMEEFNFHRADTFHCNGVKQ